MLTDNEEDDPPSLAPFALPSGLAPMPVTLLPLRLRRPRCPALRAPQWHPGCLAAPWGLAAAPPSRSGRPRPHRAAVALGRCHQASGALGRPRRRRTPAPSHPASPRAWAGRATAAAPSLLLPSRVSPRTLRPDPAAGELNLAAGEGGGEGLDPAAAVPDPPPRGALPHGLSRSVPPPRAEECAAAIPAAARFPAARSGGGKARERRGG